MNTDEHSFRMERTSYKSQDLIYEELGHKLVVYLEMSGVQQFDWVGCDTGFQKWTEPAGETISLDRQSEILHRLTEWSKSQSIRIGIGPPIDLNAMFAQAENAGFKVERRDDGTVTLTRAKRRGFLSRIFGLFRSHDHAA